jgi:hypothetical protein
MHRAASTLLVALAAALAPFAAPAETIGGNPGPAYNYVCPHADGQGAMACYLDAVEHLYTMCRNVKAIEILTYGYEDSLDGVNAAKYESCVEKQKHNMAHPYAAALKDAHRDKALAEALRGLHEDWTAALARIRWNRGESDADYKARVAAAYDGFHARIDKIHLIVAEEKARKTAVAARSSRRKGKAKSVASEAHDAAPKTAAKATPKKSPRAKAASSAASPGTGSTVTGTASAPPAASKATPDRDKAPPS